MFFFQHELSSFEYSVTANSIDYLRVFSCHFNEFTHNLSVFVVDSDGSFQSCVCDCNAQVVFQLSFNQFVFFYQECVSCFQASVLRMCEYDNRGCAFPFLAQAFQSVTRYGEQYSCQVIISTFALQFHNLLHNGTSKRRQICTSFGNCFALCAPDTHRQVACCMNHFFRSVDRHDTYSTFTGFCFIVIHCFFGICCNVFQLR